jgi:hypothetical protein
VKDWDDLLAALAVMGFDDVAALAQGTAGTLNRLRAHMGSRGKRVVTPGASERICIEGAIDGDHFVVVRLHPRIVVDLIQPLTSASAEVLATIFCLALARRIVFICHCESHLARSSCEDGGPSSLPAEPYLLFLFR